MQNRYVGDIGDYLKLGILRRCRLDIGSASHGGTIPTRATIEMGGMSAIFSDRTAGGTSTPSYSMPSPRS